jgi:uncharacterized peroxidase-related enzyme
MTTQTAAPKASEKEPLIPYADSSSAPPHLQPMLLKYQERMGFLPNALRLYLHRPEIATPLWQLNDAVMRAETSTLDIGLKRRLGAFASKLNGCKYCTTHHCEVLKSPGGFGAEGWDMDDEELGALLDSEPVAASDFEQACFDFVAAATLEPNDVPDEVLDELKNHLSPAQIIELASVVGFWKMYNTIHDCLSIPIEQALLARSETVGID